MSSLCYFQEGVDVGALLCMLLRKGSQLLVSLLLTHLGCQLLVAEAAGVGEGHADMLPLKASSLLASKYSKWAHFASTKAAEFTSVLLVLPCLCRLRTGGH
jgi:hypothetical protein